MPRFRTRSQQTQTTDERTSILSMSETRRRVVMLWGSLVIFVAVCILGGTVAGSYALTLHAINNAAAARVEITVKAEQAQAQSAKGECVALTTLDNARKGVVFKPSDNGASSHYLKALIKGIDGVVVASHCQDILDGNYHFKDGQLVPGRTVKPNQVVPIGNH
jgi:hypothetical protein